MSYNNIADSDAAWECVKTFDVPACVIVKHANPCGVAVGADAYEAYAKAFQTDPTSAFGGIIATNRPVTKAMADTVKDIFTEVVVAPAFDDDALEILDARDSWTRAEIRKQYKSLVKDLHPDMNGGDRSDEERLQQVVWAWDQIKDSRNFRD